MEQATVSQSDLLNRIASGDRQAFEVLYRECSGRLFAIALRMIGDRPTAEEALHDAFVAIWISAPRYDPEKGSPGAWMGTILRRKAIDRIRAAPWRERTEAQGDVMDTKHALSEPLSMSVRQCLERLQKEQLQAVKLCLLYGYTHRELSRTLSRPLGTVKSWVRRGIVSLRRCLEE